MTIAELTELYISSARTAWGNGPVPSGLIDIPWRAICKASDSMPDCYEAASAADKIIARARQDAKISERSWQSCLRAGSRKLSTHESNN